MAAELVMIGPGKPVSHAARHDLESFFYMLLGICVLFDEPHKCKPKNKLSQCFDIYFNTFEPSLLKTIMIQSRLGWSANILLHLSPYFQPLIPFLNTLCEAIVLPMDFLHNQFSTSHLITHNAILKALLDALCTLEADSWHHRPRPKDAKGERDCNDSTPSGKPGLGRPGSQSDGSDEETGDWQGYTTPHISRPPAICQTSRPGFASSSSSSKQRRSGAKPQDSDDSKHPHFNFNAPGDVSGRRSLIHRFVATEPILPATWNI